MKAKKPEYATLAFRNHMTGRMNTIRVIVNNRKEFRKLMTAKRHGELSFVSIKLDPK